MSFFFWWRAKVFVAVPPHVPTRIRFSGETVRVASLHGESLAVPRLQQEHVQTARFASESVA